MRRALLTLAIAALVLPAAALGKGPSAATVDGPGAGGGGISFGGDGGTPGGDALGALAEQSGLYPAVFAQEPDPILTKRPKGDLGPKYTITWTVPGPNSETWKLHQDVYPYATPAPVTYMEPGQPVYADKTHGGWFQAGPELKQTLVAAGLPSSATGASSGSSDFPTALVSLLTAFLLFAMATALIIHRRTRTRPAAA
jgi:hypothetical protein